MIFKKKPLLKFKNDKVAFGILFGSFTIFLLITVIVQMRQVNTLKSNILKLNESYVDLREDMYELHNITLPSISSSEPEVEAIVGPRGPQGPPGDVPEGHWERYCLIEAEVFGYKVDGVLMRKSDGDCESGWKQVKIWEK